MPLLLLLVVGALLIAEIAPALSAEPAWKVEQKSLILGREVIYASSRHLRIDILDKNLVLYSSAPDWNISIYSLAKSCIYKSSLKAWPSSFVKGLLLCYGIEFCELKWIPLKSAKTVVSGLITTNFCSAVCPQEKRNLYQVAEKGFMPEQAVKIVLKLDGLDRANHLPSEQFPLFIGYRDSEQKGSVVLRTIKCTSINADAHLFAEPRKAMRLVANEWDLVDQPQDF